MKVALKANPELEDSKLFGEVFLPEKWLENDVFSPFEFFVGQISLANITAIDYFPKEGYLYFFIDAVSLKFDKMRAVVRFFDKEPDACTDFNDGYFDEEIEPLGIAEGGEEAIVFEKRENEIILLAFQSNLLPIESKGSYIAFVINLNDISNGDFSACYLKMYDF